MTGRRFEIQHLEHTADVGFEVTAASLAGVFEGAARALLGVIFEGGSPAAKGERKEIELEAPELETLLVRWLDELIYRVQTLGEVPVQTRVRLEPGEAGWRLSAELEVVPFARLANRFAGEVKAATYHGLRIEQEDGHWRARVILDV